MDEKNNKTPSNENMDDHLNNHSDVNNSIENSNSHIDQEDTGSASYTASSEHPSEAPKTSSTKKNTPQRNKKRSGVGTSFIGGFFGGIVSTALIVLLLVNNLIPGISLAGPINEDDAAAAEASIKPNIVKTISDDSDTATGIDEAADAVVGVIKLQQESIWTPSREAGTGSGIIYKKQDGKAYVVTNEHVVESAEEVEVVLNDEERIKAKVLGTDTLTDLAVLEIPGDKIDTVAKIGASADLKVGETVIAIGNPLGMEFANTLTKGIVSGLDRSVSIDTTGNRQADWVSEVIQTDAAINPGNSGGALVNSKGEVIGINSMKIAQNAVEGIGFAIPIDTALPIMEQLETDGTVARPFIGITMAPINQVPAQYRNMIQLPEDENGGIVIAQVQEGSPAAAANLQQFDIITKIGDKDVTSIVDLRTYLYSKTTIGESVELQIYRNGEPKTVTLQLVERGN
ncbi:S1C family serine protease [Lentibacillus saliphilus]|uniref:S1C family serine protease n=1 Tax=Lentibacillus saliphilus TaxID=2737028 RepID=UPI001FE79520|nr:trypsin-like peptidase domain-containing protein [Lentibacillus saliphilus]